MFRPNVTFDGHLLNSLFFIGTMSIGMPAFEPDEWQVSGRGSVIGGTHVAGPTHAITLVAKPGNDLLATMGTLMEWLDVDSPRPLVISTEGKTRMAIPTGNVTVEDPDEPDTVTVEFLQPDPLCYGETRTLTIPASGTLAFTTGHPHCDMRIETQAAVRRASDSRYGFSFDGGAHELYVVLPRAASVPVTIDCVAGTATVDGSPALTTLDSDWPELGAGQHTVVMDASGTGVGPATLTITERLY